MLLSEQTERQIFCGQTFAEYMRDCLFPPSTPSYRRLVAEVYRDIWKDYDGELPEFVRRKLAAGGVSLPSRREHAEQTAISQAEGGNIRIIELEKDGDGSYSLPRGDPSP
jgi:hypothetical protein